MATYKSKTSVVEKPIEELYDKLSNLSNLGAQLDNLPKDQLEKIGNVKFEDNQFIISTPQMGEIAFAVIETHKPDKIVFGTPKSPVPLQMIVNLHEVNETSTEVSTAIDVQIPAILRPMIGPKLQEAADKFGEMISNLSR